MFKNFYDLFHIIHFIQKFSFRNGTLLIILKKKTKTDNHLVHEFHMDTSSIFFTRALSFIFPEQLRDPSTLSFTMVTVLIRQF